MDSEARHELSRAIQREGVGLFENPQRIKALLMDACPESRMEIGLLVQAAEDDIPARLARSSESVFRDTEIARAVADLKKTRRLDEGAAEWVVRSWAWAIGLLDTEPSDDVSDVTSVTPTPEFPGTGQAASPPYPSVPPGGQSGPGGTTSFPPGGSSSPSGSGPYSEPWQSGVTSGAQSGGAQSGGAQSGAQSGGPAPGGPGPAGPGSGGPAWVSQPAFQGPSTGSWGGPPPPTSIGWGAALPPPPPGRGRGRLFAALGAVAVVIVLAVVGMTVFYDTEPTSTPLAGPSSTPSPTPSTEPSTGPSTEPSASTGPEQGEINFTITNSLADFEVAETAVVYSFGQKVGELRINTSQPYDTLAMVSDGTNVDYQLKITLIATDGEQYTFTGTGAIAVYEGAEYAVAISEDSTGNYVAALEPQQGGI